ncbi:MAG: hypothetical protein K0R57_3922 [Paenibacillaceae bacterium]|jgi:hypothetical protein|nr:hypothetical protein [Paenibacillaceae bacterium]
MGFQEEYEAFLQKHKEERTGEALRRLEEGHGYAERLFLEQVWWPAVGGFEHLIPEYELSDFRGGCRYLDFAWIRRPYRICIEIDGYGPHVRELSRWQHADQLQRQNDLIIDDWIVIRFAFDEVKERPRRCEQTIQQVMGKWYGSGRSGIQLDERERRMLQVVISLGEASPGDVAEALEMSVKTARKHLQDLVHKQVLMPASGERRIRMYKLGPKGALHRLWHLV